MKLAAASTTIIILLAFQVLVPLKASADSVIRTTVTVARPASCALGKEKPKQGNISVDHLQKSIIHQENILEEKSCSKSAQEIDLLGKIFNKLQDIKGTILNIAEFAKKTT